MTKNDKTKLKLQIKRRLKYILHKMKFNDLLEMADYMDDWYFNIKSR
ncbi:MAG: hypothetical protein ACP6IY_09615 [Promethearchaeia archaeon]